MADRDRLRDGSRGRIGRQIVLPFSKSFEIAWKSLKLRIWRSLITMSGIILAIAFLMSVWTSAAMTGALESVPESDPDYRLVQRALQDVAIESKDVTVRVGVLGAGSAVSETRRVPLHVALRDWLQAQQAFRPFVLPHQMEEFKRTLHPTEAEDRLDAVVVLSLPSALAHAQGVQELAGFVEKGGTVFVFGYGQLWPEGAPADARSALDAFLPARPTEGTRHVAPGEIKPSEQSVLSNVGWGEHPGVDFLRTRGAAEAEPVAGVGGDAVLWLAQGDRGSVFWYPVAGDVASQREALKWMLEERLLGNSLRWVAREKFLGGARAKRNLWLVSLSLLVCIVGITNAMLMSVTERFREIGTMKCLGALDKFVVKLFLIESSLQGISGSLVGVVLGLLLAFVRGLFAYHITDPATGAGHWLALRHFPGLSILLWMAVAVTVGSVLSILAAIYPAYHAAKMEPVEAMRVQA